MQSPRSRYMLVPYSIVLAGTVGGTFSLLDLPSFTFAFSPILTRLLMTAGLYGMGRKVLGYSSFV